MNHDNVSNGPAKIGYPHLFRVLHWLLIPSLVVLVLTGWSLYAVSAPDWSLFSGKLPGWFWPGEVHVIHLYAALVFLPSVLAVSYTYFCGRQRYRFAQILLLGGGLVMVVTGLLLLSPIGPPDVYLAARSWHAVLGLAILPIGLLWHLFRSVTRYRGALRSAFRPFADPGWSSMGAFLVLALATTGILLGGWPMAAPWRSLLAVRTVNVAAADPTTLPWEDALPLQIELAGGTGLAGGRTALTLRALHDGESLCVLAEWDDPFEDRRYQPWERTADGWQRPTTRSEDKFCMLFPIEEDGQFERFGCAAYCHLGLGWEYGFKSASKPVDVWHWKSARTDPVGQADDKYWTKADVKNGKDGRHGDPNEEGGYSKNIADDKLHPAFLPSGQNAIRLGALLKEYTVKYTDEAAAEIAPGTMIPGILAAAFVGDRGNVQSISSHEDGRWKLYLRRKLDTGSPHDVRFLPGGVHPFSCAAFDHTGDRHAYSLKVYRLALEQ